MSTSSLFFSAKTGEITSASLTMRNVGTAAIFYCWKKRPEDPLVEPSRSWNDANFQVPRRERFTVLESSGRIFPGEDKSFLFSFMSNFTGSFFETWHLWTSPVIPDPPAPVFLKGTATTEDPNGDSRERLVRELEHREMMHGVEEVIEELQDTSSDLTWTSLKTKPDYLYSAGAYAFLRGNLGSEPPLYYNNRVDTRCQELVSSINTILIEEAEARKPPVVDLPPPPPPAPAKKGGKATEPPPPPPEPEPEPEPVITVEWDGSLSNLTRSMEGITDEERRTELLEVIPKLKESAEIPAHPSSTFHLAMFRILNDAIHPLHDAIENTLADIAAKAKAEDDARLEARRKKAEEEGLDPDMLEPEQPPPSPEENEPQYNEDGELIPPPPPPKLCECVPVAEAAKNVLMESFLQLEDEIEKLEDKAIEVVDAQIGAQKARKPDEQTLWNIFALEREKLFLILGKDRDLA